MVEILITIQIAELTPRSFRDKNRIRIVSAIITSHAQGQTLQILLMRFGGFRSTALESIELFLQCGVHRSSPIRLRPDRPLDWVRAAETTRDRTRSKTSKQIVLDVAREPEGSARRSSSRSCRPD